MPFCVVLALKIRPAGSRPLRIEDESKPELSASPPATVLAECAALLKV